MPPVALCVVRIYGIEHSLKPRLYDVLRHRQIEADIAGCIIYEKRISAFQQHAGIVCEEAREIFHIRQTS